MTDAQESQATGEPIRFYKTAWPWGYFGNFSRHPIKLDGAEWPTTEHYYQAQKFVRTDPEHMDAIRVTEKAGVAANMGRDRNHPLDPAWEEIKYHVMLLALIAKFTQNDDCNAMLLTSGDRHIIEDTGQGRDDDHIWGDGSTGTGQNLLGKALMEVRDAMRRGTLSGHGHHLEGTTRLAIRQAYGRIPAA